MRISAFVCVRKLVCQIITVILTISFMYYWVNTLCCDEILLDLATSESSLMSLASSIIFYRLKYWEPVPQVSADVKA